MRRLHGAPHQGVRRLAPARRGGEAVCSRLRPPTVVPMPREVLQWKHLYSEVVTSGLCTGCAGCVVACPHDVLGYDDREGAYKPFHLEEELGPDNCTHGEKGCTS